VRLKVSADTEAGAALVVTLWILAALGLLALTGAREARIELRSAAHLQAQARAQALARGAVQRVGAEIARRVAAVPRGSVPPPALFAGTWLVDTDDWSVSSVAAGRPTSTEALVVCDVVAEDARFPIALATANSYMRMGFDRTAADGLEALSRESPTPSAASLAAAARALAGRSSSGQVQGLVTPFSSGRIYINAATADVLATIPGMAPIAAAAVASRTGSGRVFEDLDDLLAVPGVGGEELGALSPWVRFDSGYVRVRARARVAGAAAEETAIVKLTDTGYALVARFGDPR
jgi:DNA uptake protein ComE-like DNA-binding protein